MYLSDVMDNFGIEHGCYAEVLSKTQTCSFEVFIVFHLFEKRNENALGFFKLIQGVKQ